ncbi:MAG: hypothetical protein DWQ34_21355 [Planctomycetota bacterium]|nr:MAG: hypothetical protein DWQ34_21355 [Planctomycetota bacterium]REK29483.1 MAG: hypothetical protein DWQ41_04200 [Planctomycetota bacterium]REK31848.1 MAG: hypothetical protein DWQ45_18450 [Planctomycetota bacterium]
MTATVQESATGRKTTLTSHVDPLPPAIVFHGGHNALSIVRSLGRRSIPIYTLNEPGADAHSSRYARPISLPADLPFAEAATRFLTGRESDFLKGAVLLAASDEALEVIANHRTQLADRFRLDLSNSDAQLMMLDKLATYNAAREAGVPAPRYWEIETADDLHACRDEFVYPLIVKPKLSHLFQRKFNRKFLVADSFDEVLDAYRVTESANIGVMLVEKIPGPDSQLGSYYTYLDEHGEPLFDFTKRIIRRYPTNMGLACYHITDHVEGVRELTLKLCRHVKLRGLASVEFKLDKRDGQLKLIECNARFTGANVLVAKAGFDLASFVYNRAVGLEPPQLTHFRKGLRLWDPARDFRAYRELSRRGEMSAFGWIRSVLRPQTFPVFTWSDPKPVLASLQRRFRRRPN